MLSIAVGRVFIDALVLSLILYIVARHEADYEFQKLAMVVAGTALGNMLLFMSLGLWLPPAISVWVMPLAQVVFSAYMIMTFCWISFWKSLLVAVVFSGLHIGFGLGVDWVVKRMMGGAGQQATLVERQEQEVQEIKNEMMRMAELEAKAFGHAPASTGATPEPAEAALSNALPAAGNPAPAPSTLPAPAAVHPASVAAAGTNAAAMALPQGPLGGAKADWGAARAKVKIGGSSSGKAGGYVALVNQRLVEPGNFVSVLHQGRTYRWVVRSISRDSVDLEPYDVR